MYNFTRHEDGSEDRYNERPGKISPNIEDRVEHRFWWIVHNCLAHPLIGLMPIKVFFKFHDWTSRKLNRPN